jgi:hypothetical protein
MNGWLKLLIPAAPWALVLGVVWAVGRAQAQPTGVAPVAPARPASAADVATVLPGFWEHERCQVQERDGQRTGSRSLFAIFDREWGIAFTQYADAACQRPVLTATLRGTYEPTAASAGVPGATNVTFRFAHKGLTAHDPALVDRLNGGACGSRRWALGIENDVTATGCLAIEAVSVCAQEFDLVRVDGDRLYLGERPQPGSNICAAERRPLRLRSEPLRRR